MVDLSVLDLAYIGEGFTPADALANTLDLAQHVEAAGFTRFWLAEHHNLAGIASAATAVCIGHVAGGTISIRVGAGGIMLPNHSPMVVAEQFGTLATLYPGRIDLGMGRAPGTDQYTLRALRRGPDSSEHFPQDVLELQALLGPPQENQAIHAIPGENTNVPLWILGSSLFGAQLAAMLGLPYAFASHFAPAALETALAIYRQTFRPSPQWQKPYFMMATNVFAADTDKEGRFLMSSMQQAFANLRSGRPGKLPPPVADLGAHIDPGMQAAVSEALTYSAAGSPDTVRSRLAGFIEQFNPDEIIITGQIHDHNSRLNSFEIAAEALGS